MDVLAQVPLLDWEATAEHSIAVAVVLFCGYGLFWTARRLFGETGIITLANAKNTETMERNSHTLIELKELNASQQVLCGRHAKAMDELVPLNSKVDRAVDASEAVAESWSGLDAEQFRVEPVLNVAVHAVDTLEKWAAKHDDEFVGEIRILRQNVEAIRNKLQTR